MGRFYVTTPIYYVNDLPHIGHIYTTVVADTLARYRRLVGDEVYFLTGTDEHGQKIERAARKEGIEPIALADKVVSRYHELWEIYGISHDDFIRTTEPRHAPGVEAIIRRIEANGDLYPAEHEGWYCVSCELFYTDKDLLPGNLCPVHEQPAERQREENIYFRLSRYQQPLLDWIDANPGCIQPETRRNEMRAFVEQGLRDLSVSRASLAWGIPFPGHAGQTVYVWLDALTNYISALGFGGDDASRYETFWDGEGTRLHLIGKDISRQHCIYWPAFLMSAGLPLPTTVWVHGWWLRDERKISKSVGNLVRPDSLVDAFGADALRYFLLREMVFGQDANFSDEAFVDRFNSDLANDLGNTVSRLTTLSRRAFDGRTPPIDCDDNPLIAAAEAAVEEYRAAMDELAFHRALAALWGLLAQANQYIVEREPWHRLKEEKPPSEALCRILWNGLEATRIVAVGLLPFMPELAPRVLAAIGAGAASASLEAMVWGGLPTGAELPAPEPLFPRIDKEAYLAAAAPTANEDVEEESSMIDIEHFKTVELKVGTVTTAERIEGGDRLLKLIVDLGEGESRQLVAGIAQDYAPDSLVGRQVIVVANLKPAKLRGVESQGMVLAATVEGGKAVLLQPDSRVSPGSPVS